MRIAVFGAGGIGGYFGARLAQAGDEVALIARGPHLRAIQEHGLFVESPTGDFHMTPSIATDRPEDVGVVDVVLLGIKAWDVRAAAAAIRPMVGPTTGVLTLQNGVDAPTEVAEVLGDSHVMVGVAPVRSVIAGPGRLRHVGGVPAPCAQQGLTGTRHEVAKRGAGAHRRRRGGEKGALFFLSVRCLRCDGYLWRASSHPRRRSI